MDALVVREVGNRVDGAHANRPAGVSSPIGEWPNEWADYTHEFDEHGLDANPDDRVGELRFER